MLDEVVRLTIERLAYGFVPFVFKNVFWRYPQCSELDRLPIYFVTGNDIGGSGVPCTKIPISDPRIPAPLRAGRSRWSEEEEICIPCGDILSPLFYDSFGREKTEVDVPGGDFFAPKVPDGMLEDLLNNGTEMEEEPGCWGQYDGCRYTCVWADWLGLYIRYDDNNCAIFVWVDRILSQQHLMQYPTEGVLMVVLHELAHAFMDIFPENFRSNPHISPGMWGMFAYAQEEAMANAFAHRALRLKGSTIQKKTRCFKEIERFMDTQPAPYALGAELARASIDYTLVSCLRTWMWIKSGRPLAMHPLVWFNSVCRKKWPLTDACISAIRNAMV